ncbi:MAG: hypothetical protein WCB68_05535 [Pyrinomonadaceae bacterium]
MKNEALLKKAMAVALLLSNIPFLILTAFIHPAYDDFCFAGQTLRLGAFAAWKDAYNTWTGKYFGNLLYALNPLVYGSFTAYKILALLIILLTLISVFCLVNALFKSGLALVDKLLLASFITALFSNQMPEITEGYFWMGATLYYQLGNILCLFFFALATKLSVKTKGVRVLMFLSSCILIVAIIGSTETTMVIFALLVFTITIKTLVAKSAERWMWLVFLILTIACAFVVLSSPGNAIRSSYFPNRSRFLFSLGMSLRQEISFLLIWFSNISFLLGTILFIPVAAGLSDNAALPKFFRINPLIPTLLLLLIIFLGLFPAYWSTGMMGQHRTVNTAYFFFLIGWFICLVVWINYLKEKLRLKTESLPSYVYVICVPVLLFNLYFSNNTRGAIADLVRGRAYRYDIEVKKRYAQFEQCAREGRIENCPVAQTSELPATITNPYFETEMSCEKSYWILKAPPPDSK